MAKLLSGTATAAEIRSNLKVQVDELRDRSGGKFQPGLTIVQVSLALVAFFHYKPPLGGSQFRIAKSTMILISLLDFCWFNYTSSSRGIFMRY